MKIISPKTVFCCLLIFSTAEAAEIFETTIEVSRSILKGNANRTRKLLVSEAFDKGMAEVLTILKDYSSSPKLDTIFKTKIIKKSNDYIRKYQVEEKTEAKDRMSLAVTLEIDLGSIKMDLKNQGIDPDPITPRLLLFIEENNLLNRTTLYWWQNPNRASNTFEKPLKEALSRLRINAIDSADYTMMKSKTIERFEHYYPLRFQFPADYVVFAKVSQMISGEQATNHLLSNVYNVVTGVLVSMKEATIVGFQNEREQGTLSYFIEILSSIEKDWNDKENKRFLAFRLNRPNDFSIVDFLFKKFIGEPGFPVVFKLKEINQNSLICELIIRESFIEFMNHFHSLRFEGKPLRFVQEASALPELIIP